MHDTRLWHGHFQQMPDKTSYFVQSKEITLNFHVTSHEVLKSNGPCVASKYHFH